MKVSVVLIVHNRFDEADNTLKSLIEQSEKPYEIIIIDDYSCSIYKPRIKYSIKNIKLRIYRTSHELGLGLARSLASYMAEGDIIAFIDDDAIAHKDWIKELVKYHSIGYDIVGGSVYPFYLVKPPSWWNLRLFSYIVSAGNYLLLDRRKVIDLIYGTNFSVMKYVFKKIGYFNPYLGRVGGSLLSGEEFEFLLRALKKGFKIGFNPKAVVYHKVFPYRFSIEYVRKRCWSQGVSYAKVLLLHKEYRSYFKRIIGYSLLLFKNILELLLRCPEGLCVDNVDTAKVYFICELYRKMGFLMGIPR